MKCLASGSVAQELAAALRASQREIENLLQRAASLPQLG